MKRFLCSLFIAGTLLLAGAPPLQAQVTWFALDDYQEMKKGDPQTLELILSSMLATVFYAQESVGKPVICASPALIPGDQLIAIVDEEIEKPTHPQVKDYANNTHVAFILLNALKRAKSCE
jgi:hypothetical protein